FDPSSDPHTYAEYKITLKALLNQRQQHKILDLEAARVELAALASGAVVRGDWRPRVTRSASPTTSRLTIARLLSELGGLGFIGADPMPRHESFPGGVPISNFAREPFVDLNRKRFEGLARQLTEEVPSVASYLAANDKATKLMVGSILPYSSDRDNP